jgi:transposase InsO family protein
MILQHFWWLHGLLDTIISDHGKQFASGFWQQLCIRLGIQLRLYTAFHPETVSQMECVKAVLEQYF